MAVRMMQHMMQYKRQHYLMNLLSIPGNHADGSILLVQGVRKLLTRCDERNPLLMRFQHQGIPLLQHNTLTQCFGVEHCWSVGSPVCVPDE